MNLGFQNWKKREIEKENLLVKNGGMILERIITSFNGKSNPFRIFSVKELEMATNGYDQALIFRTGLGCVFYKGSHENRLILIKKFIDEPEKHYQNLEESVNEITLLSQMNHKNVLQILGYCSESEIPSHVYEFPCNGVLFDFIGQNHKTLSSKIRLKIAVEIAEAITYLHTGICKTILHRDIKPSNIFLDENYSAKLSDLRLSVPIPEGKTYIEDSLKGTMGFVAPESFATGNFTEKNDVFSFGILLLMLLTGKELLDSAPPGCAKNARSYEIEFLNHVTSFVKNNELNQILEPNILMDGEIDYKKLQVFVDLAMRCIERNPEKRPRMLDVAKELRRMKISVSSTFLE